MNCKNCNFELGSQDNYCINCGAFIVKNRITIKAIIAKIATAIGLDNNIFRTLKGLLLHPNIVLSEYIGGTRKKYINPFSFFAIGVAIGVFVYSNFSDEYLQMATSFEMSNELSQDENKGFELLGFNNQNEFNLYIQSKMLKYQNITAYLMLPLYALIALILFGKPYNYGEHLVINTYLMGFVSLVGVLLFGVSLWLGTNVFLYWGLFTILYFGYAYKKLYKMSIGKIVLKTVLFFGLIMGLLIIIGVASFILGFIFAQKA